MALVRTGGFILKSIKPVLNNPCIPPTYIQVRYAARKGYRDKKRAKKAAKETPSPVTESFGNLKKKYTRIEKTLDLKKPPPPDDDIFISEIFNYKKYTLSEAVSFHREYHHPEIYNNPHVPVSVRIEINMTAKKSTQFLKPFKGVVSIPHPFVVTHSKEILVLCPHEHVELALSSGASIAGGAEVIKKIQEGTIQPSLYEYIIAHPEMLSKMTPIRNLLKDQMPRSKIGTLTSDLKSAIYRFRHGIEYTCSRTGSAEDFGFIDCNVGLLDMELNHLEENFQTLIKGIEENRPERTGDFISWIWCTCKPSDEKFAIDISKYVTTLTEKDFEDFEEESGAKKSKTRGQRKADERTETAEGEVAN